EFGSVFRKVARKYLEKYSKDHENEAPQDPGKEGSFQKIELDFQETLTEKSINKYLGPRKHRIGVINADHEVGICTGLAWTEVGGDLVAVEVNVRPGKGKLICTGKLGEVMQESAQAALSYVRSRSAFLDLEENFYDKIDLHIHVPEGAIPKDGPSAGIA